MTADPESGPVDGPATLLAIGDVHLGTRPASLPPDLSEWGVDPRELTPEAALGAAVDHAIAEQVDAVLLAGDVVESTNARFEAIRPLEAAVRRLVEAGIPTLAVVGNHDVEALPRLARLMEGLTLLGANGRWGSHVIRKSGRAAVEVLGWSFPEGQVRDSPLADLLRTPLPRAEPGLPRLGLLHADLDASGGVYAPVSRRELDQADVGAWLLGHIHRPSLGGSGGNAPCGYLGSLVGLDPTETGARGPWLIRVESSGRIVARHLPIAPLRWERLEVAVREADGPEDVGDRLLDRAEGLAREIRESGTGAALRALGIRARLVGTTRHYDAIRRRIAGGDWDPVKRVVGATTVFVEQVTNGLEPALDLRQIASGHDPPALLARRLLSLREGGEARRALLDLARRRLRPVAEDPRWAPLAGTRNAEDPLSDEALASLLEQAGIAALDALVSQGEGAGGESS